VRYAAEGQENHGGAPNSPRHRRVLGIVVVVLAVLCLVAYGSMVWTISSIFSHRVVVEFLSRVVDGNG